MNEGVSNLMLGVWALKKVLRGLEGWALLQPWYFLSSDLSRRGVVSQNGQGQPPFEALSDPGA